MAFGLAIGTERAAALQVGEEALEGKGVVLTRLQTSIQNELTRRGLSADGTPAFPSGNWTGGAHSMRRRRHGGVHHHYDNQQQDFWCVAQGFVVRPTSDVPWCSPNYGRAERL